MLIVAAILVLSYLVGSIPTAIIVSRKVAGIDIRDHGSGNAGGTNVIRVLGWKLGITVILLDALKGVIAVLGVTYLFHYTEFTFGPGNYMEDITIMRILAGVAAIAGHVWSVFADFRGGKGVATTLGTLAAIASVEVLIGLGVFFIALFVWKYVSLGSILAALTVPTAMFVREQVFHAHIQGYQYLLPFLLTLSVLVVFTHRKNIARLRKGKENKVNLFGKKSA
ncbi:MAG: glycerol-3-phosphate 1-O-acyltransferase PlsY [Ignavibacteriales bacterium]|nr:glycerol-3-phosphate 1-O-acyltransferase PlsY [Ignavibacteriales bacterium]